MSFLAGTVLGFLAGAAAYLLGVNLSPYVDSPLLELVTASVPFTMLLAGGWAMTWVNKAWLASKTSEIAVPQSLGILLLPGYLLFFGDDHQVLGGLATVVLCLPAVLIGTQVSLWVLRRIGGA